MPSSSWLVQGGLVQPLSQSLKSILVFRLFVCLLFFFLFFFFFKTAFRMEKKLFLFLG